MGRRKTTELRPYYAAFPLGSAVVRAAELDEGPVRWWSQAEAERELQVSDRTLRNWAGIGLPVRPGPHGRPIYPEEDCRVWVKCWRDITENCQRYKREAPKRLTLLMALNYQELLRATGQDWRATEMVARLGLDWLDYVVLVPHDVGGFERARLLKLAAQGITSDDGAEHPEDERLFEAHGVPRGYELLDVGWPEPPPELRRGAA